MMPRKQIGLLCCIFTLVISGHAFAKDRIAIVDFENKSQHGGWALGRGASDILTTELVKTGKFSVMERETFGKLVEEQRIGLTGLIDPSTAAEVGKLAGVDYIITGAVTEYGQSQISGSGRGVDIGKKDYHATVDVRMVSTTTGEIVFADSSSHTKSGFKIKVFGIGGGEGFNEKSATEALRIAIQKLASKITSAPMASAAMDSVSDQSGSENALVADVDNDIITLNKGRTAGFKVGQTRKIIRKGKVIKDPETGQVIRIKYKEMGAIKIIEVEDAYTEGRIVSGTGIKIGDEVQ